MSVWAWGWLVWFVLAAGCFAVMEWRAVTNRQEGDTLTETVRAWFHSRDHTPAGRLGRVGILLLFPAFAIWFTLHLLYPGFV